MPTSCIYYFQAGEYGWQERWWKPSNVLKDVRVEFADTVPERANSLGDYAMLTGTMCRLDSLWNSSVWTPNLPDANKISLARQPADTAWNCLRTRVTGLDIYTRNVFFHAPPDDWILYDANNNPTPAPRAYALIKRWWSLMATHSFGWYSL